MKNVRLKKHHELRHATLCTIAFAAISAVLFSCAKEELDYAKLDLIGDPKPVTVNATLPKSASLDKTVVESNGKVKWELSDSITVNSSVLRIKSLVTDTLAEFYGSVGAINTPNGNAYWATYPASLNATGYTSTSVNVTLPTTQTCGNGGQTPNYMAAFATANRNNLHMSFKNLCCIVRIPVKAATGKSGDDAKLSRIEVLSNQNISGAATVNWNNGSPTLNCTGGKTLTLNCGNIQLDNSDDSTFSVMLPAGTHSFTVKFYATTGRFMQKTLAGDFERNKIYTTGAVTMNATELPGLFSVSSSQKVRFSQGNLQWTSTGTHDVNGGGTAAGTWRFAEHQWDYIGNANSNISSSYSGWIDLFGWGTSGYNNMFPYMTSTNNNDYGNGNSTISGTNRDWGVYNAISNGGNQPDQWRTLTQSEWTHLFLIRSNASSKWGLATVNGVQGMVLLPDDWTLPSGLSFTSSATSSGYGQNTYDSAQWKQMEANGAVFLPASGNRNGTSVEDVGSVGYYWSSSHKVNAGNTNAHIVTIKHERHGVIGHYYYTGYTISADLTSDANTRCNYGNSVRLVQNATW